MKANEIYARNRAAWRNWLKKNHDKEKGIWLILQNKGSKVPNVKDVEAVEEALCFGWIDSVAHKRDATSHLQYFAPRKARGVWSKINKARIERLIQQGLMTDAGLAKIEAAKKNGSWGFLDDIEELKMPSVLRKAFTGNKKALKNFEAFPPSTRKAIYVWIVSAKQPDTLAKRIHETVTKAAKNIRANQWVRR